MAKLPNASRWHVPDTKLSGYLLSDTHPDGAPKAKFLKSFGFSATTPETLREAVLDHADHHDVSNSRQTEFGTIFEVEGQLQCPDGRTPFVRVVWMTDTGSEIPRLITLVPSQDNAP